MLYTVDYKKKIIFGWSAKCGCSHVVKMFWYFENGRIDNEIHTPRDNCKLPEDIENYEIILFIRNPYERLISGFLDKYNIRGQYRKLWLHDKVRFEDFVSELINENWNMIDKHHFTPQTSEYFREDIIQKCKKYTIYDIKNINYSYLEKIFGKTIPEEILKFRGGHEVKEKSEIEIQKDLWSLNIDDYYRKHEMAPNYKLLYNDEIKQKVKNFYKNDFEFFEKYGVKYGI